MGTAIRQGEILDLSHSSRVNRVPLGWLAVQFALGFGVTGLARASGGGALAVWALPALGLLALAMIAAVTRLDRRRHRARVHATVRSGRPLWESDWTGSRRLLRRGAMGARVSAPVWIAAMIFMFPCAAYAVAARTWEVRLTAALVPVTFFVVTYAWVVLRGGVQVRLARFPDVVGESATFHVATTEGSPRLRDTIVQLRCDSPVRMRSGSLGLYLPTLVRRYWTQDRMLSPERQPGPDEFVEVSFDVPADVPGAVLSGGPPVRWELTVSGSSRWGDVEETFLVPVYERPTSASTS